jgi:hypothetical protein
MHSLLALGGKADLSGSSIVLVLEFVLILGVDALLVTIPIVLARRRGGDRSESIAGGAILWGLVAALSAGSAVVAQFKWASERNALLMGGYDVPSGSGEGPQHPWGWWIALAAFYAVLVLAAVLGKRQGAPDPAEQAEGPS